MQPRKSNPATILPHAMHARRISLSNGETAWHNRRPLRRDEPQLRLDSQFSQSKEEHV